MIKPSYFHRTSLMVAGAYVLGFANTYSADDDKHVIFPPLQLFSHYRKSRNWQSSVILR